MIDLFGIQLLEILHLALKDAIGKILKLEVHAFMQRFGFLFLLLQQGYLLLFSTDFGLKGGSLTIGNEITDGHSDEDAEKEQ